MTRMITHKLNWVKFGCNFAIILLSLTVFATSHYKKYFVLQIGPTSLPMASVLPTFVHYLNAFYSRAEVATDAISGVAMPLWFEYLC